MRRRGWQMLRVCRKISRVGTRQMTLFVSREDILEDLRMTPRDYCILVGYFGNAKTRGASVKLRSRFRLSVIGWYLHNRDRPEEIMHYP